MSYAYGNCVISIKNRPAKGHMNGYKNHFYRTKMCEETRCAGVKAEGKWENEAPARFFHSFTMRGTHNKKKRLYFLPSLIFVISIRRYLDPNSLDE